MKLKKYNITSIANGKIMENPLKLLFKKIYRTVYDNYFKWADITFIGYINRKIELMSKKSMFLQDIDMENVSTVVKKNRKNGYTNRRILIECGFSELLTILSNNIMQNLISADYATTLIGMSVHKEPFSERINSFFGIKKYVYIYNFFDFKINILSLINALKTIIRKSQNESKIPKAYIDGIDIGDQVYDEILRKMQKGSIQKRGVIYFLFIYRAFYFYFRFKKIVKEHDITDIITSHSVYTGGILVKAASIVDPNIKIWFTYPVPSQMFTFSSKNAYEFHKDIPTLATIEDKKIKFFQKNFTNEEIEKIFNKYNKTKLIHNSIKDFVSQIQKPTIKTLDELYDTYKYDKNKKNVFIYLQTFIDGVMNNRDRLFPDYYIWANETLKYLLNNKNINIFVKPHPIEMKTACTDRSENLVQSIKSKYQANNVYYLKEDIDNKLLYDFIDVIFTSSGTIGIQAPCYGIPVITSTKAFYFEGKTTFYPKTLKRYIKLIENVHLISKLSNKNTIKAKIVYIISDILTLTPFSIKKTYNEKSRALEIDNMYKKFEDIRNTDIYLNYSKTLAFGFKQYFDFIEAEKLKNLKR